MRVCGWGLVAKILVLGIVFLAGYGLASAHYLASIDRLLGNTRFHGSSDFVTYINGMLVGLGEALVIVMLVQMPPSVRLFCKRTFCLPSHKKDDRPNEAAR